MNKFKKIFEGNAYRLTDAEIESILKSNGYEYQKTKVENKQSVWKIFKNKNPKVSEDVYSKTVKQLLKLGVTIVNTGAGIIKIKVDPESGEYI
jgi:ribose 5-phosphate isomerase RpiB